MIKIILTMIFIELTMVIIRHELNMSANFALSSKNCFFTDNSYIIYLFL